MNIEETGKIYLGKELNEETAEYIIRSLLVFNDNKKSLNNIKFYINCEGGDLHHAFGIIDLMNSIDVPVHTYSIGTVCSAGLYIFMSGMKGYRYTFENTLFMSHQWYTWFEGKEHELSSFHRANKVSSKQVLDLYTKCTGLTTRKLRSKLLGPTDYYFGAEEAIEHGFADLII